MVIALYKPYGVLCQFTPDQPGQRTLAECALPPNVYSVGRLDLDSEGLLLLTDEAGFNHRLLDPGRAHPRNYLVQVEGLPSAEALRRLAAGSLVIQGYRVRPAKVAAIEEPKDLPPRDPPVRFRKSVPTHWLQLTLTEGKNRQVRRMTAAVGLPTLRLVRVAIGGFTLGNLQPGEWRTLDAREVASIWQGS